MPSANETSSCQRPLLPSRDREGAVPGLFRYLAILTIPVLLFTPLLPAQVCRVSVAGLNQSRRMTGQIHAECPEDVVHTAPFGNWGVTSNFGQKHDSHQFDGWCHDLRVCDNAGLCKTDCTDGWYEWNSCTDDALYKAPNCSLYNAADCTEQVTSTGINVHGTKYVDIAVRCPLDTNGDGIPDQGGCQDVQEYGSGANFLSLYELDPVCCDQLVQTVYFPPAAVKLTCDVFGCAPAVSPWMAPSSWDSPTTPAKVFAELAVIVNWGGFVDPKGACRFSSPILSAVSAASFEGPNLAPESIASVFGSQLSPATAAAATIPLPTSLEGISAVVTDRNKTARTASLFYISPGQVNFQVPAGTAAGPATVAIYSGEVLRSTGSVQIDTVAPALFTANADGKGVPSAFAVHVAADGTSRYEPVFDCGPAAGSCLPRPIDLGLPTDSVYLLLFGTGLRNRTSVSGVGAVIGGTNARVEYAGPQNQFVGLDQVNVLLPRELAGRGTVAVALTVDSKPANQVQIAFR